MALSIRARLILAMNVLVAGVGVAAGWAGVEVSGRAIEHRLVDESARNAAGLFETMRLPMSDAMMLRLRQVLGAEVAAGPVDAAGPAVVVSSLSDRARSDLRSLFAQGPLPRRVLLAGDTYVVGEALATDAGLASGAGRLMRLYLLVPEPQVEAAKRASARTITLVTGAAIVLATLLGFWISTTIARPIRRLAARMDGMSEGAAEAPAAPDPDAAAARAPAEVARLARSFDRLLARLDDARRQLAQSARLATVGQIAAGMAHELRNPLSGIKMNARVLADELARAGIHDSSLDRIIREADRMDVYLGELLGLASGSAETHGRPHDLTALPRVRLDEVGESVLALVEGRCRHGGVEVRRAWDPAATAVQADETEVRQVVLNLVLNALDTMPGGGSVALSTAPGEAGTVRFSVTDTGKGLHVADGVDVFEPFVSTKPGGVGLGLYVCRRNVARHGGRIGYDTSPSGTTFWFELPAAD